MLLATRVPFKTGSPGAYAGVDGVGLWEIVPEKNEARNSGGLKRGGVLSKERAR